MNFIEGKVEWHGNGVVVIKKCSMLRSVWLFCLHGERLMYSIIQRVVGLSKSLPLPRALNTEGFETEGAEEKIHSTNPSKEMTSLSTQAQKVLHAPVATETQKQQLRSKPRPMGTLTEIRRYAGSEYASSVANGGEQSALQQLLPALAGFCHDRWLVLVSPPQRPTVAELTAVGIDPSRVLLVHARDSQGFKSNGLKVVETALQSGTCGAVVAWLEECDTPTLQRLRYAAVAGHAWGVMFREDGAEQTISQTTAYKTGEQFAPSSLSAVTPVNDGMRETASYIRNTSDSKVVNIHSDSTKEQLHQPNDVTQIEMAMS